MARQRNPRRVALEVLRNMKSNLTVMVTTWSASVQTYDVVRGERGQVVSHTWRKRVGAELPENNPEEWVRLAKFMSAVIRDAEALREYALQQRAVAVQRQANWVASCGCALARIEDTGHQEGCTASWRGKSCEIRGGSHALHIPAIGASCIA